MATQWRSGLCSNRKAGQGAPATMRSRLAGRGRENEDEWLIPVDYRRFIDRHTLPCCSGRTGCCRADHNRLACAQAGVRAVLAFYQRVCDRPPCLDHERRADLGGELRSPCTSPLAGSPKPGLPIAAVLISSSLWRTNTRWRSNRSLIMTTAHATWISLALMTAYLAWAVPRAGGFNAEVWAGSMNRLVVGSYLAWQIATACCLLRYAKRA